MGKFIRVTDLQRKIVVTGIILIAVWIPSKSASAQAYLFPGVQATTEAGLSQTNTRGATAVLTNPANIGVTPLPRTKNTQKSKTLTNGIEAYADISLLTLTYSYTRPGADPTSLSVFAPPITLGASWRPIPQFAIGLEIIPRPALSAQVFNNLPLEQEGNVLIVNGASRQSSFVTGVGASIKGSKFVSFGLSIIETAEDNSFSASDVASSLDIPLVQMSYKGSFIQEILGARITPNNESLIGLSYRTSVVKKYTGSLSLAGAPSEASLKEGYLPSVIAVGGEYKLGAPLIFGEIRHESWSAGAGNFKSGLPSAPESTALQDTNIFIVGGRYRWRGGHAASLAFGRYPSNVQYGSALDSDGKPPADATGGIEFGDFDALDRMVLAGGYKYVLPKGYVQGGLNIQQGSKSVPAGYRNVGEFKMSAFTFTGGGAINF